MKTKISMIVFLLISNVFFSCSEKEKEQTQMEEHAGEVNAVQSELVRTGEIDVVSLDKNGDGKVYECPMDWNVLNDEHGDCPVCGMKLKEYSIADVQQNLTKYGYKYKK
jgi:Heavy metal binding domain